MQIIQKCLIQSVSYLREKISYEEACKHSESDIFKHNKIITTKKYYSFVRCKTRTAKKIFKNYEKITFNYDHGAISIVAYYNKDVQEDEEEEEEEEEITAEMKRIQSVLIPREQYSLAEAIEHIKVNYGKIVPLYISTLKYYRFILYKSKYLTAKLNLNNIMVISNNETGIKEIIFHRQGKK